jgi:lipopolysaccharide export system protein LptA
MAADVNAVVLEDQQVIDAAKIKQSLSTGQNRLRRNKGTPADIVAIR